jgi:NADH:ubiquinone oxidoreductase subunit F (NADH-binding)/(2Fe-2S) ferredoxin
MRIRTLEDLQAVKEKGAKLTYPEKIKIMVGMATCGISAGADKVYQTLANKIDELKVDAVLEMTGCIGFCQREPLVDVVYPNKVRLSYQGMTPEKAEAMVVAIKEGQIYPENLLCRIDQEEIVVEGENKVYANAKPVELPVEVPKYEDVPFFKKQVKIALRNCGYINPERIEEYIGRGGYKALYKALKELKPIDVIGVVKESGLRGRGGGGFPTGMKWEFAYNNKSDMKYVICNADEGDPGAFMDRGILEGDPHAVVEGMAIGAYAIGAKEGYVYCRAEYPLALKRLEIAIQQAEERGLLGDNIFGSDFSFRLKIREGAGAFVCGEETALIASIEGKVGEPRQRPPFPAQSGLWEKPTIINNVKTWSHIAPILVRGAEWYGSFGAPNNNGTTVFALVGKINDAGLVEIPLGTTLREMIFEIGGGIPGKHREFKAVQTGGPSGGCIPAEYLDTPVEYDSLGKLGSIMGSGGMIVMDDRDCMVNVAKYFLDFTQEESCGKCTPCREGTPRMLEILEDITQGKGKPEDIDRLIKMSELIKKASLCGLGQTAPNPVLTTIKYFREEYEAHIKDHKCPAKVCKALITFRVDPEKCNGCHRCFLVCPTEAITGEKKKVHEIKQEKCIKCGTCFDKCKFDSIIVE